MSSEDEAQAAVTMFNGSDVDGRSIVVDIARERAPREGGFNRDGGDRPRRPQGGGGYGGRR
jgi:RNA recognition motif-containing protein